ncbi:MAG: DUF3990 domain-containing protein [Muribaculaceae bacterium]|nr:DUF3990 domain-containing protein [Muribaculaceae bacterium]
MDKIEVYHAGTEIVENPDCSRGRTNLDFGQGFYITDIYDQAYNFAHSKSKERKRPPLINVYLLDKKAFLETANYLIFDKYDEHWLEFIVECRSGGDIWKEYDYIEGGIADDRVIDTVNMYIQGFISRDRALKNLRYLKPNNQICILNQKMLERHLKFTACLKIK